MNGEVVQVLDLWAADDAQTGCDIAAGRNRAGVRFEGCTQAADGAGEEVGFTCASASEAESLA